MKTKSDYDIAMVLYAIYKDQYVCINIANNIWYEFRKNQWKEIDSGTTLRSHPLKSYITSMYAKLEIVFKK